jgi:hypothetical protein
MKGKKELLSVITSVFYGAVIVLVVISVSMAIRSNSL